MARPKKQAPVLTKAEVKTAKEGLKAALKVVNETHSKFKSDARVAAAVVAKLNKDHAKAVKAAVKVQDAAAAKLAKADAAAEKGRAKIEAQIAALTLSPATTENPTT